MYGNTFCFTSSILLKYSILVFKLPVSLIKDVKTRFPKACPFNSEVAFNTYLKDAVVVSYDSNIFTSDDAGIEYNFSPNNTSIVIENGTIIKMNKTYMP